MAIQVCDAPMGSGKTSAAIAMMNQHPHRKYLFVTPYLEEVQRIMESCPDLHFETPKRYDFRSSSYTKSMHIRSLLKAGKNVATTHALFFLFDAETIQLIRDQQYTLIMDEVIRVVEKLSVTENDRQLILKNNVMEIADDGLVKWLDDSYPVAGRFNDIKSAAQTGKLYQYSKSMFLSFLDLEVFHAFADVFILTFMFESQEQCALFRLNHISYQYIGVERIGDGFRFTQDTSHINDCLKGICNRISICGDRKRYAIGDLETALSSTSFYRCRHQTGDLTLHNDVKRVASYMKRHGFCADHAITTSEIMWTCYEASKKYVSTYGLGNKNFVPCNARAENKWGGKTHLIYLVNRYMDTNVKIFFQSHGIALSDDAFALAEMVQWVWRSAIRNGQHIWLYVPSSRMRRLFTNWMESVN